MSNWNMIESLKLDLIEYRLRYILTGRKKRKGIISILYAENEQIELKTRIFTTKYKINYNINLELLKLKENENYLEI